MLDDHLSASLNGSVVDDLARNDAPDVVVVSNWGVQAATTACATD